MNKIAEQLAPIMNDEELQTLIDSHYENQAQTLTTGAEANLLKFKITGQLATKKPNAGKTSNARSNAI